MKQRSHFSIFLWVFFLACLQAQDAHLVFYQTTGPEPDINSNPEGFILFDDRIWFQAAFGSQSLWSTDGTEVGTTFMQDHLAFSPITSTNHFVVFLTNHSRIAAIDAGEQTKLFLGDYDEDDSISSNDYFFFLADDMITRIGPTLEDKLSLSWDQIWRPLSIYDNQVYFKSIVAGSSGYRIGKMDDDFTNLEQDILGPFSSADLLSTGILIFGTDSALKFYKYANSEYSTLGEGLGIDSNQEVFEFGETFLFCGRTDEHGVEPWASNGTAEGTYELSDTVPGTGGSYGFSWFSHNGQLYALFKANGTKLAHFSGSPLGLTSLSDVELSYINLESLGHTPHGTVFQSGSNYGEFHQIWVSDGTLAGTQVLLDSPIGQQESAIENAVVGDDMVFFTVGQRELWRSDGCPEGTIQLHVVEGQQNAQISNLYYHNGLLYFDGYSLEHGVELWISDGTLSGTDHLKDINPGFPKSTDIHDTRFFEDHLVYVTGDFPVEYREVDQIGHPSRLLCQSSGMYQWGVSAHGLNFISTDLQSRPAWFVYNPTTMETTQVYSFDYPFYAWLGASFFFPVQDGMFYVNGAADGRLFFSDGTVEGTRYILGLYDFDQCFGTTDDHFIFKSSDRLFSTDAQGDSIQRLTPSVHGFEIKPPIWSFGDRAFFQAQISSTGYEPWVTDGTPEGTKLLIDLLPGPQGSDCGEFVSWQNRYYFTNNSKELWCTDLATGETNIVTQIDRSPIDRKIVKLIPTPDQLFMLVAESNSMLSLWVSKGTETSTYELTPLLINQPEPFQFTTKGNYLFFAARTRSKGIEPWISDGSIAGTRMLFDIEPGVASSAPSHFQIVGSHIYFSAWTSTHGREFWAFCQTPNSNLSSPTRICLTDTAVEASVPPIGPDGSYIWSIQNGVIITGQGTNQIEFEPTSDNNVQVQVLLDSGLGCQSLAEGEIVVDQNNLDPPSAIQGPDLVCANEGNVVYSVEPVPNAIGYEWEVPPGSKIQSGFNSPSIQVQFGTEPGMIRVAAVNGCDLSLPTEKAISFYADYVVADAGPDLQECGDTVSLQAEPVAGITGTWQILSGTGGQISAPNDPHAIFQGVPSELYRLRWVLDLSPCSESSDEMYVYFAPQPSDAMAGEDIETCGVEVELSANIPSAGIGVWTSDDPSVVFADAFSPFTLVTAEQDKAFRCRWTIHSGVCSSQWDEVTVVLHSIPEDPIISNVYLLEGERVNLRAKPHPVWLQEWSIYDGPDTHPNQIFDPGNPQTAFSPNQLGSYTLKMRQDNWNCFPSIGQIYAQVGNVYNTPRALTNFTIQDRELSISVITFEWQNQLYFLDGTALWRTDGYSEQPELVKDHVFTTQYCPAAVYDDAVYFFARRMVDGELEDYEIWKTDGTTEGTMPLVQVEPTGDRLLKKDNGFFFTTGNYEKSLWFYSRELNQITQLVHDVSNLVIWNNELFFIYDTGSSVEDRLWRSDGTTSGTQALVGIAPGPDYYSPDFLCLFQGKLVFKAIGPDNTPKVWSLSNPEEQMQLFSEGNPRRHFVNVYDQFLLTTEEVNGSNVVAKILGPPLGHQVFPNIKPYYSTKMYLLGDGFLLYGWVDGNLSTHYVNLNNFQNTEIIIPGANLFSYASGTIIEKIGKHYVFPWNGGEGVEIWQTDGTAEGTGQLLDMSPGNWSTSLWSFTSFKGNLVFYAKPNGSEADLYRICLKPVATIQVPEYSCFPDGVIRAEVPESGSLAQYSWNVQGGQIIGTSDSNSIQVYREEGNTVILSVQVEILGGCIGTGGLNIPVSALLPTQWHSPELYHIDLDYDQNGEINILDFVFASTSCL